MPSQPWLPPYHVRGPETAPDTPNARSAPAKPAHSSTTASLAQQKSLALVAQHRAVARDLLDDDFRTRVADAPLGLPRASDRLALDVLPAIDEDDPVLGDVRVVEHFELQRTDAFTERRRHLLKAWRQ